MNIQDVIGKDQTPESQAKVKQICDKALLIFDQYMAKHAEMMEDRGCEGTLVSVWNSPIRGLKIYRAQFGEFLWMFLHHWMLLMPLLYLLYINP